jgi:dipeptidyl-peptidase-4
MRRALVVVALIASPLLAAKPPLTVERLFADPPLDGVQPREVTWLPDGSRFSYLERTGEGRDAHVTLWVEQAARTGREQVASDADLESQGAGSELPSLHDYQWSPDGSALLLEGGGDLFLYDVAGKRVRRLTATPEAEEIPAFSPDGRRVAFVRANDLYVIDVASGKETRVTEDGSATRFNGKLDWVYTEEIAGRSDRGYAWSPDSKAIVYLSLDESSVPTFPQVDLTSTAPAVSPQIYPKAGDRNPVPSLHVAELDPAGGDANHVRRAEIPVPAAGGGYIPRFGWLPGGGAIWLEALNREQTRLELIRWSSATASSAVLLTERDSAWVDLTDDLRFLKDGNILWSSERSGYRHLYLYDAGGKEIRHLTAGKWEVTKVEGVDETRGWVYFTATQASVLTRNLYRVKLDGTGFQRLTFGGETHRVELSPSERVFLDYDSALTRPTAIRVIDADGRIVREVTGSARPELDAYELSTPELVNITSLGETLHAYVLKPPEFDPTKHYPAIVSVYGGPGVQVVQDAWNPRSGLVNQVLAAHGFVVLSVDGRGTPGRGRDFERTLLRRFGKVELEDQLALVSWFRKQPWSDPAHVGIWGGSYGGFMTCYALVNAPGVFAAGVAVAPVTDWRLYDSVYTERYLKMPADNPDGYRESSPVNQAARLRGKLLLIHGTADDNVHVNNTLIFADKLVRAGIPYELQLYGGATHRFYRPDQRSDEMRRVVDFFERTLKH